MRAQELWRFAPRLHIRTEPERAMAVPGELMPSELQEKMVAAFERARAERLSAQIPREGAGQAVDPWTRANTAAFLILEREHRAIAVRLSRPYWRRGDRYRDLILVTELIRLEYEHLAGRVGRRAGPPAPHNGSPAGDDMPADWARPWGSGPMVEIGTALIFYLDQRDRLASRLPARTLASTAADAARGRDRIVSRFERAMGEWRLELEDGRGAAADSGKLQAAPPIAEAAGDEKRAWPWASLVTTRRVAAVAAVAAVFVAVGVGAIIAETRGGESAKVASAPSPVVARVPDPLAALGERSRKPQPARGPGARHGAAHKSRAHQRAQGNAGAQEADQTALTPSEIPPPAPKPAAEPVPAPTPPPPPDNGPAPEPTPDPKPGPGPVSSLPPPVGGLPAPGGSGGGGG
jgi:hypothetical protein